VTAQNFVKAIASRKPEVVLPAVPFGDTNAMVDMGFSSSTSAQTYIIMQEPKHVCAKRLRASIERDTKRWCEIVEKPIRGSDWTHVSDETVEGEQEDVGRGVISV
jgi:hypothetical protein